MRCLECFYRGYGTSLPGVLASRFQEEHLWPLIERIYFFSAILFDNGECPALHFTGELIVKKTESLAHRTNLDRSPILVCFLDKRDCLIMLRFCDLLAPV
jgi:hypothetical protein